MIFCSEEQVRVQIRQFRGPQGEKGEQGPQGERGMPGVVIGTVQPDDPGVSVWINPEGGADEGAIASEETRGCVRIGEYLKMNGDVLTLDLELLRQALGTTSPDTPDEEVSLAVDAQGQATLSGATITVADDGSATVTGAALEVDENGNAVIA